MNCDLNVPLQCALPYSANNSMPIWLGASIHSKLGELSQVQSRFFVEKSFPTPTIGSVLKWKTSLNRNWTQGYIHQVLLKPYDSTHNILEVHGSELSSRTAIHPQNAALSIPKNFSSFIQCLLNNEISIHCTLVKPIYTVSQWLQWHESSWDMAQRMFLQLGLCPQWQADSKGGSLHLVEIENILNSHVHTPLSSYQERHRFWKDHEETMSIGCSDFSLNVGQWVCIPGEELPWIITHNHRSIDLEASILGHGPESPFLQSMTLKKSWRFKPWIRKPMPILKARIALPEGSNPNCSPIQRKGCYSIEFPWASGQKWGSIPRMLSSGFQQPLLPHTPVLIGFPQHNPDCPMIIGVYKVGQEHSRTNQYCFTTPQGNRIQLDDLADNAGKIQLSTAKGWKMILDDQTGLFELSLNGDAIMQLSPNSIQLKAKVIHLN